MNGENRQGDIEVVVPTQFSSQNPAAFVPHSTPEGFAATQYTNMMNPLAGNAHGRIPQSNPARPAPPPPPPAAPPPPPPPPPQQFATYQNGMPPTRTLASNTNVQWTQPNYNYPQDPEGSRRPHIHEDTRHDSHSPYSPHAMDSPAWDKSRQASFQRSPHEQQYMPKYNHPHSPFTRNPIEPPNAAPSPPSHYPPNSPLPSNSHHMGPPPNIPDRGQPGYRGPHRASVGGQGESHEHYRERSSISSAAPPPYSQGHGHRSGTLGPGNMGPPMTNGSYGGYAENHHHPPTGFTHMQHRGGDPRSAGAVHDHKPPAGMSPTAAGGRTYQDIPKEHIKLEPNTPTGCSSMSPIQPRGMLEGSMPPMIKQEPGLEPPKKRGKPLIKWDGKEYYENDRIPDEVPRELIPAGFQLGVGKQTKGILLPIVKDGITVNPEWGFTAGGKARQRLPQACVNCRQKKIKCVEGEDIDKCQHCQKMGIACEKDEEKKKKSRGSSAAQEKIKLERSGSLVSEMSESRGGMGRKRKQSEETHTNNHRKVSRPVHSPTASVASFGSGRADSLGHSMGPTSRPDLPPPAHVPSHSHQRPPLFPTMAADEHMVLAEARPVHYDDKSQHVRALRGQYQGTNSSMTDASPQSLISSPSNSAVGAPTLQGPAHFGESLPHAYAQSSSSQDRSPHSGQTPAGQSELSIPHPMGEDPRHLELPSPEVLRHLVDVYFKCVYSQTYAFLHRPTFERRLHEHSPILLFSICAVASRFSNFPQMEEHWAVNARYLIMTNFDVFTIEVVQAMVNMGLHDFGTNKGNKAWMFCGMAVRMGASMNLNLESRKQTKNTSFVHREVARRTFWSYYMMDRFNSYGVARPYIIQDHDCHVQLPCDQPSFWDERWVTTETLLGPNRFDKHNHGNKHMGAMAYLVRITRIWGNILKQIHLTSFEPTSDIEPGRETFEQFIRQLDEWRNCLPRHLSYSDDNLAGQAKWGTTGAFVIMHVMWHTAMQYVHRYIRTIGVSESYIRENINPKDIVESIQRAFVHADSVLQIMTHVQTKRAEAKANGTDNIVVNAPFLGQAISDACNITAMRAVELHKRGYVNAAQEQADRVYIGLTQLKELKRYWKPLEAMYSKLKSRCNSLRQSLKIPPPVSLTIPAATLPTLSYTYPLPPDPYQPPPFDPSFTDPHFNPCADFLAFPLPHDFMEQAFVGETSQTTLFTIAGEEGGFRELYEPQQPPPFPPTALSPTPPSSPDDHLLPDAPPAPPLPDGDINAMYFDPLAVSNGKLDPDAGSEQSHSRPPSTRAEQKRNPMDVMYLVDYERPTGARAGAQGVVQGAGDREQALQADKELILAEVFRPGEDGSREPGPKAPNVVGESADGDLSMGGMGGEQEQA